MPSIDFYFIPAQGAQARFLFACRLLEKAYQQKHQIYVHTEAPEKSDLLDKLLWTFRDESFIPHQIQSAHPATPGAAPIQIGHGSLEAAHQDILLNLHPEIPAFHNRFTRILEIITAEPTMQTLAKEHREFYEEKGYKISLHQLNK